MRSRSRSGPALHQHRQRSSYSARTLLPRSRPFRSAILVMTVTTSRSQWLLVTRAAFSPLHPHLARAFNCNKQQRTPCLLPACICTALCSVLCALCSMLYALCSIYPLYILPRPPVGASGFFRGSKKTRFCLVFLPWCLVFVWCLLLPWPRQPNWSRHATTQPRPEAKFPGTTPPLPSMRPHPAAGT